MLVILQLLLDRGQQNLPEMTLEYISTHRLTESGFLTWLGYHRVVLYDNLPEAETVTQLVLCALVTPIPS